MTLTDPTLVFISINVSPDDAVQFEVGGEVTVILNIDPLSPLKATIGQSRCEATLMPAPIRCLKTRSQNSYQVLYCPG